MAHRTRSYHPFSYHALTYCLALSALVACSGCGGSNELGRREVSGQVTLDGVPLATGNINFMPLDPDGVSSGTVIADGQFQIAEDRGLPPGEYRVQVFSTDAPESSDPLGDSYVTPKERIPARYNTQSELTVRVEEGGAATFAFELTTEKGSI